jgi:hypothetical protein
VGVTLVLATWLIWLVTLIGIGHLAAGVVSSRWSNRSRLEASAWVGLLLVATTAAGLQMVLPMGGRVGNAMAFGLVVIGVGNAVRVAWVLRHQISSAVSRSLVLRRWPSIGVIVPFGIGLVLAANFALAEPTDADAGLYRVGSIRYAEDFRILPGLANLHTRFGFNSSLWPLAALSGAGPWGGLGYRLITGIFLTVLFWSLVARVGVTRRSGAQAGDWFTVLGSCFVAAIIFTDSGRWVPSPAQDLVLLIAGIGSTAYLLDFLSSRSRNESAAMALLLAALAGTLRPLGWVGFTAIGIVLVLTVMATSTGVRDKFTKVKSVIGRATAVSVVMLGMMIGRDALLSGWLLYPLTYFPAPVDWRAPSPKSVQSWITWYARTPGSDGASAVDGTWLRPWIESAWNSRELTVIRWILLATALPVLWGSGRVAWKRSLTTIALAIVPSFVITVTWFITAPDLRFGWWGLIGVAAIPLSVVLANDSYPHWLARALGVVLLGLLLVTQLLNGRVLPRGASPQPTTLTLGSLSLTIPLAPPPKPLTVRGALADGTPIVYPPENATCWEAFPLCLPSGSGPAAERRGDDLTEGFRAAR